MNRKREPQEGSVLLLALALLFMLSLFAVAFARLMSLERAASANRVDWVRARLAASAGVKRATVELQKAASLRPYSDPWTDGWGYRLAAPQGYALGEEPLDLFTTAGPSFGMSDDRYTMFGQPLVYSGFLGTPHGNQSALIYKLRVFDSASQVNLNHPDKPAAERMLRNLLRAAGVADTAAGPLAANIVQDRPPGGFMGKPRVVDALRAGGLTDDQTRDVRDRITTEGWIDPKVIRPWNLNNQPRQELIPLPRSPVNLNSASAEVLTALFAEAKAVNDLGEFVIDYDSAKRLADQIVAQRGSPPFTGTTRFTPFRTWSEFEAFVDALDPMVFATATHNPPSGGGLDRVPADGLYETLISQKVGHKDLVKAIANPNTMLNKLGIQPHHGGYQGVIPRLIDKTDLVDMTTDGCLDSMGVYEITSMGLVLFPEESAGTDMKAIAMATEQVTIEIYRPLRLTTQEDFEKYRAMGIPGNFIGLRDKTWNYGSSLVGLNKGTYFDRADRPLEGWPGMISWPEYSLERSSTPNRELPLTHLAADWDGHLTLTNLIGVRTTNPDWVAGFARGRLEAFKARAWHELKDEDPTGARTVPGPTHPADPTELASLTAPLTGINDTSPNATLSPRIRARSNPGRATVLDQVPGPVGTGTTRPKDMFKNGASLLNTGVLISPERLNDAGKPQFLAYSSDNLDLVGGTSIRFWVQPQIDPYSREKEVLLSFVGSRDGKKRQVGFKVYKEALASGAVSIVLEAIGEIENDESGLPVDWNWASRQAGATTRIEVDVTPASPYTNDPLNPQWVPGSWHWVVVNIGPGKLGFNQKTEYFATLQVDKRRSGKQLFYKGNKDKPNGLHEYGELHGHAIGAKSPFEPLLASNITTNRARCWIRPRLLGDYYHCQAGSIVTGVKSNQIAPSVVQFQGNAIPQFPFAVVGSNPGSYVQGPNWPTVLPFPVLSYNHRLVLEFLNPSGGQVTTMPFARASDGSWSITFPNGPSTVYGSDGYPGNAEWSIGLRTIWTEAHPNNGCPRCNTDTTMPADVTTLPSIEEDPDNPVFGEPLPYSVHNSGPTFKGGVDYSSHPKTGFRSWVRVKKPIPHPQGLEPNVPAGPPFGNYPITYIDDDCHGCEDCDVDGPIYIGGEPSGNANYVSGSLAPVDSGTMACAVFDNIVFRNGDEAKRTDWPGANRANTGAINVVTGQPVVYTDPGKDFEDRFFESNLSTFVEKDASFQGYGAVYHRGLLELDKIQACLGTLTWTSYAGDALDFELGVWRADRSGWKPEDPGMLSNPGTPDFGGFKGDAALGLPFAAPTDPTGGLRGTTGWFSGLEDATGKADMLVLGVRLVDASAKRGSGEPLPAPLVRTPILEDITLTLIHERARVLQSNRRID